MGRYPTLAPLALKALDFPLSSISAERTFAMGRAIDLPCRRSQSRSTFCREMFLRVNRALAVRELECARLRRFLNRSIKPASVFLTISTSFTLD